MLCLRLFLLCLIKQIGIGINVIAVIIGINVDVIVDIIGIIIINVWVVVDINVRVIVVTIGLLNRLIISRGITVIQY